MQSLTRHRLDHHGHDIEQRSNHGLPVRQRVQLRRRLLRRRLDRRPLLLRDPHGHLRDRPGGRPALHHGPHFGHVRLLRRDALRRRGPQVPARTLHRTVGGRGRRQRGGGVCQRLSLLSPPRHEVLAR